MLDTLRRGATTGTPKGKRTAFPIHSSGSIKKGRSASRPWLVIVDPSGDFLGRCFRSFDLNTRYNSHWPVGIVFEHQKTGRQKIFIGGNQFAEIKDRDK